MKNNQKGSVLIWAIVIIVIVFGIGLYFYSHNKNATVSSQTSQGVSDWKTYINNQYGFSFQYPSNLVAFQNDGDGSTSDVGWILINGNSGSMSIYIYKASTKASGSKAVTKIIEHGNYRYEIATRDIHCATSSSDCVDRGPMIDQSISDQIISSIKFTVK